MLLTSYTSTLKATWLHPLFHDDWDDCDGQPGGGCEASLDLPGLVGQPGDAAIWETYSVITDTKRCMLEMSVMLEIALRQRRRGLFYLSSLAAINHVRLTVLLGEPHNLIFLLTMVWCHELKHPTVCNFDSHTNGVVLPLEDHSVTPLPRYVQDVDGVMSFRILYV